MLLLIVIGTIACTGDDSNAPPIDLNVNVKKNFSRSVAILLPVFVIFDARHRHPSLHRDSFFSSIFCSISF